MQQINNIIIWTYKMSLLIKVKNIDFLKQEIHHFHVLILPWPWGVINVEAIFIKVSSVIIIISEGYDVQLVIL